MDESEALRISREVAKKIRQAIGEVPVKERGKTVGMGKDGTPTKLIDRVAENAALDVLRKEKVTIISEEAGVVGEGDVFVALDPLDGTFNAAKGVPIYSVSLCFADGEKLGNAFFGYVFNLATGDEYYADKHAYKNGERIAVAKTTSLFCNAIVYYPHMNYPFKRMRVFGSAATEMCMVAEGAFDCFIDIRDGKDGRGLLRIYDVAAGIYITEKAGGKVTDVRGETLKNKRFSMDERLKVVAANESLHKKILELIA